MRSRLLPALVAGTVAIIINTLALKAADLVPLATAKGGLLRLLAAWFAPLLEKIGVVSAWSSIGLPGVGSPLFQTFRRASRDRRRHRRDRSSHARRHRLVRGRARPFLYGPGAALRRLEAPAAHPVRAFEHREIDARKFTRRSHESDRVSHPLFHVFVGCHESAILKKRLTPD